MDKKFIYSEELAWVPTGYDLEDNSESDIEWDQVKDMFRNEFVEFSENDQEDYELPDWHYETKCLFVHLYNEDFLKNKFISRIEKILNKKKDWIAKFECFNKAREFIGNLMFWNEKIYFTEPFSKTKLIELLKIE